MKYQFYAIVYDVAGNQVSSKSSSSPLSITTEIQYVTGLTISPSTAQTKNVGQTFTITPSVTPSNANNKNVNWNSSNTTVATVSSVSTASGTAVTVTCKAAGTATITATAADGSGKKATISLTVYDKVSISTFSYSNDVIREGATSLTPSVSYSGTAKSGPTYSSSNSGVATVASNGKLTGIESGKTTVYVFYVNYDGTTSISSCMMKVYPNLSDIDVTGANLSVITDIDYYYDTNPYAQSDYQAYSGFGLKFKFESDVESFAIGYGGSTDSFPTGYRYKGDSSYEYTGFSGSEFRTTWPVTSTTIEIKLKNGKNVRLRIARTDDRSSSRISKLIIDEVNMWM